MNLVLGKPTKKQFDSLQGNLEGQIKTVLMLAKNEDGTPVFSDVKTASYKRFCQVIKMITAELDADVAKKVFLTEGLARLDITIGEVERLFAIEDQTERFDKLVAMVRGKLRLNGKKLTGREYDKLPYADQLIAINGAVQDITGEGLDPLPESVKA